MTTVRLAVVFFGVKRVVGAFPLTAREQPPLLVSYYHLNPFLKHREEMGFKDWVMDSGAFSAHMSGAEIDLTKYIETCQCFQAEDSKLTEVFALDVIGDWKAGLLNCERMWKAGVQAIPCYHYGEPEHVLLTMARDYPRIALGGVARAKPSIKIKWAQKCFSRVWPKSIHGFGFGSEECVMAAPFASVDATSWMLGPTGFYTWKAYGGSRVPILGSNQNLRPEVEWYMRLEAKAKARWGRELKKLEPKQEEQTA